MCESSHTHQQPHIIVTHTHTNYTCDCMLSAAQQQVSEHIFYFRNLTSPVNTIITQTAHQVARLASAWPNSRCPRMRVCDCSDTSVSTAIRCRHMERSHIESNRDYYYPINYIAQRCGQWCAVGEIICVALHLMVSIDD